MSSAGPTLEQPVPLVTRDLLDAISAHSGLALTDVESLSGETGAVSACTPGSGSVVVKLLRGRLSGQHTADTLAALHEIGVPVPTVLAAGNVAGQEYLVQVRLTGANVDPLPLAVTEELFSALRRLSGRADLVDGPNQSWAERVRGELDVAGVWRERWTALRQLDPQAAAFVADVEQHFPSFDHTGLPDTDVVHGDLYHGNLLVDGGALVGIVDWDDCGPGDGRADLVNLFFAARTAVMDPALAQTVLGRLRSELDPDTAWWYFTREIGRTLGWFADRRPGIVADWLTRAVAARTELVGQRTSRATPGHVGR